MAYKTKFHRDGTGVNHHATRYPLPTAPEILAEKTTAEDFSVVQNAGFDDLSQPAALEFVDSALSELLGE